MTIHRDQLAAIRSFPSLVKYLRDEMGWPIGADSFEDLTFDYAPEELGIDPKNAAKIEEIKRLRPLASGQPWGIFFVKFEPKHLPVVALRRILSQVVLKKRATAKAAELAAWAADDLLFISNYGEGDARHISFAHFSMAEGGTDLPTLKVLGWDNLDTPLHLGDVAERLKRDLSWPGDEENAKAWRQSWRGAFALQHREVVTTSQALSVRLAELARAIRDRIGAALAIETENGPLSRLMKAFQGTLVHDLDREGFADMYAQTIAYGLLSSRIANPKSRTADDFAAHMRTNPLLRELMQTFLQAGGRRGRIGGPEIDFDELGVSEVVGLLDRANMEAVLRDFGDRNPLEDPVIHFYELFLKAYDAKKRMQRGVFYTPRPVVSYIVRSVDELLRTEFGLADGLADTTTWGEMAKRHKDLKIPDGVSPDQDFVQILDPATGTGTFLVEVIDLIHKTLVAKWKGQRQDEKAIDALWNAYVPKHLLTRLHGYELLMAPYAIAHLKIGLKLYETGYRFGSNERARVYLTNALEPAQDFSGRFEFVIPALAHEAAAVSEIKSRNYFTVVIGNPPYSLWSQNLAENLRAIIDPYRLVDGEPIKERGALQFEKILQDDYIKFFRLSQTQIDRCGSGILGLIINHAFIDNPTLRGMRNSLLRSFSKIFCANLHGNSTKKEKCPDGSPDINVFDIQQGVAIFHGVSNSLNRTETRECIDIWGTRDKKYEILNGSDIKSLEYRNFSSKAPFFLFKRQDADFSLEYGRGWAVGDIFQQGSMGIVTARDHISIAFDDEPLLRTAREFRDSSLPDIVVCEKLGIPAKKGWDVAKARALIRGEQDLNSLLADIDYRPFDTRRIFYHRSLVWGMSWPTMKHVFGQHNIGISTTRSVEHGSFQHVFLSNRLIGHHFVSLKEVNYFFPLWLSPDDNSLAFRRDRVPNLKPDFLRALAQILSRRQSGTDSLPVGITPEDIFQYAYAVFHSPIYRSRYAEFLRLDFPRLPLTRSINLFSSLAQLGGKLTALHLLESSELAQSTPKLVGDRNAEVEKVSWSENTVWIDKAETTGFQGVSEAVWNFRIGGYQVCEKWLKDRKRRILSAGDIAHYQKIVVAIAETIRLMGEIDEVIEEHGGWPGAFASPEAEA
ncbi:type ISP restriction/modification enzyme [Roseomonas chloroacetimidivorans]|uniref:type ISP restriction/modification enzyme n=1 Tax=Roseomonas chloroacetimidivorans TaxID=1766656 RepID=UPI003C70DC2F